MTKPDTHPHPRTTRFRELWHELGVDLPELSRLTGRPRGTLTAYTHSRTGSRVPPRAVIDELDDLVMTKAMRIVNARGYVIAALPDEVDQDWLAASTSEKVVLSRAASDAFLDVEPRWQTSDNFAKAIVGRQYHSAPPYRPMGPGVAEKLSRLRRSS